MNISNHGRSILHVDLDAFFVSVERVLNPRLYGRPVVVGGSPETRGVVAAASYEARQFGVHSAMPMGQAFRLCPDLIRVGGSHGMYSRASKAVFELIGNYTPLVEKVSVDEAYLDLSGTHHLFGNALDAADSMRREVKERLRLDLTIGISSNRLVSKVASGFAKPCGLFDVRPGQEPRFFAPLPVKVMPGIGPVTAKRLRDFHIDQLGVLASTDGWFLEEVFGSYGASMQRRARGVDETPVCPPWDRPERKSLGHERTFAEDIDDLKVLRGRLQKLLEKACVELRSAGFLARTLSVKVRYADFVTVTRDFTLPSPSDHDLEWWEVAQQQLERLLKRRTLVRLLGVRFTGLERGFWQGGLFEKERVVQRERIAVQDRIRKKYGEQSVQSGDRLWLHNSQ